MYVQESQLLDLLKRQDPDNKGGVNIAQMQQALSMPGFTLP